MPKTLEENLHFRKSLIEQGDADPKIAEQLWLACKHDILFFFNAFGWIFEARDDPGASEQIQKLPFITYPFQDKTIRKLQAGLGRHDMLIEKSRDMGASWMCLLVMEHAWHFNPNNLFLWVSRNENYVDDTGNPKSLFWKLDYYHRHLPEWLMPRTTRTKMHISNDENGSVIDGESTNQDVARGDRRRAILLDEFAAVERDNEALASTGAATHCRIFNSTPQGSGNAFYQQRELMARNNPERLIRLHWSIHPGKNQGLYTVDDFGEVTILDTAYKFPADYKFDPRRPTCPEGVRSPIYDAECARSHPQIVKQEWDIDYLGSDSQFFEDSVLKRNIRDHTCPPDLQGSIEYDTGTFKFVKFEEKSDGPCRVWCAIDGYGQPPQDRDYVMGIDTCPGKGASNSVISVVDKKTAVKVLEYATPWERPERFGEIAVVIARWFHGLAGGAFIIWESNGPGQQMGDRIYELGYRNFYYRTNELSISKKQSDTPGWWSTDINKRTLMTNYRRGLDEGKIINRSIEALRECSSYIFTRNLTIEHSAAASTLDPSGAKSNHGDRVIADALAFKALGEITLATIELAQRLPEHCVAKRHEEARRERLQSEKW